MKLLMSAGVRGEAKWLSPLVAAEAEFGPTTEGTAVARPAFTTIMELSSGYRARLASLAPVPPGSRRRPDILAMDAKARPHRPIVFPEDEARRYV